MRNRGVGAVTVAIGVTVLIATLRLPEAMLGDPAGPRLLPLILSWVLIVLGVLLTLRPSPGAARGPIWGGGGRLGTASALLFVYAFLVTPLGYLAATAVVLLALLVVYNPGRLVLNGVVAVVFTAVTYGLFHTLLGVYLPKGVLG